MFAKVATLFRSLVVVCCLVLASAVAAMADTTAVTVDYTAASATIMTQIGTALTAALPIMGAVLAIVLGVRIFKKFAK